MIPSLPGFLFAVGLVWASTALADLGEIHNYHQVDGTLSTGGHVMAAQIEELEQAGFELVVNLATVNEEHNASDGPTIAAEGISYVHIPVPWSAPSLADLDLFFAVMEARGERKTLVHCMANYRASAFVYLYRTLRGGVPDAQARADLEAIWDEEAWREYPQWRDFVRDAQARAQSSD